MKVILGHRSKIVRTETGKEGKSQYKGVLQRAMLWATGLDFVETF